jgi:hypothetical protein
MIIKTPYKLNDRVMSAKRLQSYITSIEGIIYENGEVKHLIFDTAEVTRNTANAFKGFADMQVEDYKSVTLNPPIKMGQIVLYQNSTYGNIGILAKGKVTAIEFKHHSWGTIFWYQVNNKKMVDKYNIYIDENDFKERTKPKEIKGDNQRYIFTNYCIQQNRLEVVDIEKISSTHYKIFSGYKWNETIRGAFLYNSTEKFYNKFLSQIK